jgi:hypothetical protein
MTDQIKDRLRRALHKDLVLDLEDRAKAEARKAFEMIRDHSGLDKKRAREAEGQARFRMMEQGFEEVCALHGGHRLEGDLIPHTELKVFQPFTRFEVDGKGIILGLAAMPEPKSVPVKNKSRLAGVSSNYYLSPRLDLDGKEAKIGDVFGLLLVSRHRQKAGQIEEIAVGVVDSKYDDYLFYEPLDKFLSGDGYSTTPTPEPSTPPLVGPGPATVSLKKIVVPFVRPEAPDRKAEDTGEGGSA